MRSNFFKEAAMPEAYGFPVASAKTLCSTFESLGIVPWRKIQEPMSMERWLAAGVPPEQQYLLRYAPQSEVVFYERPDSTPAPGVVKRGKDWATIFTLVPHEEFGDLVPVVAEFKFGAGKVGLHLPSGTVTKEDAGTLFPMQACAWREWHQETGIVLESIETLALEGIVVSGGQDTDRFFPFLGIAKQPITVKPQKLDEWEILKMVFLPLGDFLEAFKDEHVNKGYIWEDCAISTTFLALQRLGGLQIL